VRVLRPLALLAALALLPGCTDSPKPKRPAPGEEEAAARGRLAVLAQKTADGGYDATYRFVQRPSNATGTIRIRQEPPQYRIDVTSKGTASFFALTSGVVSCTIKVPKGTSCFLVSRPGEEVPALFDPGVQRLFRDAVEELAKHPADYRVTRVGGPAPTPGTSETAPPATGTPTATGSATAPAPSASGTPGLPAGECFRVERLASAEPSPGTAAAGFEDGTYCFAERGIATQIEVASGVLELTAIGGEPHPNWFIPPAGVQRLPELSASPTPSR
jgi:hypothetical protein